MNSRRAWLVVSIGTVAYLIAVMQRASLGIAAVDATERFGITAAALSTLAVAQIIVYAGLQIPVGVVLDRIGPRPLILTGAILIAAGQTLLALTPEFSLAVVARVLVGMGDAMTFISVNRLIAGWFSGRALPLLTQAMGTVGAVGQILSAVPLSALLHTAGWTPAYLSAAALSVVAAILVLIVVRNRPPDVPLTEPVAIPSPPVKALFEALKRPGTQLGFWAHFVTQSSQTMFTLLWGFPFLSVGLGYGPSGAAALLTVLVASGVVVGPILGILSVRYPYRRSNIVLAIVTLMAVAWALLLAWPGQPPLWFVIAFLVVIAIGGPASLIGFDFARMFNPKRSLGSASGFVNVGGFLASFVMMLVIGFVLDIVDRANGGSGVPAELYAFDSFRLAFLVQFVVFGVGTAFLLHARHRTRRRMHEDEGIEVAPLWVVLVRAWRGRRGREH